jgi:hypothetical protein
MFRQSSRQTDSILRQLRNAEAELEELNRQLNTFEARVDAQLGTLLDQLSELNLETSELDGQLRHIREERLYGKERMSYLDGAPLPRRPPRLSDLPSLGISRRGEIHSKARGIDVQLENLPDIKALYHRLARRYHPDLARSPADRSASNEQMALVNQAYEAGDMKALMRLAGIGLPYGVELPQSALEGGLRRNEKLSEAEQAERKLKAVRQQISHMSSLPIVKLSLEVKLAEHAGRNLLREMAADLQYKVGRKLAERDYLQAQIRASGGQDHSNSLET